MGVGEAIRCPDRRGVGRISEDGTERWGPSSRTGVGREWGFRSRGVYWVSSRSVDRGWARGFGVQRKVQEKGIWERWPETALKATAVDEVAKAEGADGEGEGSALVRVQGGAEPRRRRRRRSRCL